MKKVFKEMLSDIALKEKIPQDVLDAALKEQSATDAISLIQHLVMPELRKAYRILAEECDISEAEEKAKFEGDHSKLHPRIELNIGNLEMILHEGRYPIDLERLDSSAELLDTWMQVAEKTWCDAKLCGEFYNAIEHACHAVFNNNAQGVFCPGGQNRGVDWKKRKSWKAV